MYMAAILRFDLITLALSLITFSKILILFVSVVLSAAVRLVKERNLSILSEIGFIAALRNLMTIPPAGNWSSYMSLFSTISQGGCFCWASVTTFCQKLSQNTVLRNRCVLEEVMLVHRWANELLKQFCTVQNCTFKQARVHQCYTKRTSNIRLRKITVEQNDGYTNSR